MARKPVPAGSVSHTNLDPTLLSGCFIGPHKQSQSERILLSESSPIHESRPTRQSSIFVSAQSDGPIVEENPASQRQANRTRAPFRPSRSRGATVSLACLDLTSRRSGPCSSSWTRSRKPPTPSGDDDNVTAIMPELLPELLRRADGCERNACTWICGGMGLTVDEWRATLNRMHG